MSASQLANWQVSAGAIAWLLVKDEDIAPIPGTKCRQYLEENATAVDLQLTTAEIERIEAVAPQGIAAGDRYPDTSSVNR